MADIAFPINTEIVVPVNLDPIVDETDGFTREAVAYNAAGMALEQQSLSERPRGDRPRRIQPYRGDSWKKRLRAKAPSMRLRLR